MPDEMKAAWQSSWLDSGNQSYLNDLYEEYLADPTLLSEEWRKYLQQIAAGAHDQSIEAIEDYFRQLAYQPKNGVPTAGTAQKGSIQDLIFAYRLLGHMRSNINPLKSPTIAPLADLELEHYGFTKDDLNMPVDAGDLPVATGSAPGRTLAQVVQDLQKIYCGTIASEYLHITDSTERDWVQLNLEKYILNAKPSVEEKIRYLELLTDAEGMEKYLGSKYPGAKRFSLEGCDSLIVSLDEIINRGSIAGIHEIVIAMAHRGRLNVLVNLLGKMPGELFDLFEETHTMQERTGDVKYHQGFASDITTQSGNVHLSLAFNPSHLEIVTPVACGSVRARQERRPNKGEDYVICVALHGDAAVAGQGIVMEILNMSLTPAYGIGGTVHIITNNQIGFTTSDPRDARSTMYCSDIGKMMSIPVFHVNADDPEAVALISRFALEYRMKFHKDVIIDLIGYRRWGHNEADEPSATQPLMYQKIRAHPTALMIYTEKLIKEGVTKEQDAKQLMEDYRQVLDKSDKAVVKRLAEQGWRQGLASDWTMYNTRDWRFPTPTQLPMTTIKQCAQARDKVPDGFTLDPRVAKIIEARTKMTAGEQLVDWGYAETLAYATLVNEGYGVRLSGQDCGRGTFFHRHAEWHDHVNGVIYTSLEHISDKQARFQVYNSLLSEAGVLGFEYGYSSSEPRTLTLWEAQFGDFANGAQVVVDQFISSAEQKWGRLSGLVLLLPHGYEGQGPEHSSARIERYLQLCAQHNIQVCMPSTPAQMYHMLRRQILRPMRKPLVAITPKSLLRNKDAVSTLEELASGTFQALIPDQAQNHDIIDRVILCSGKVYYELAALRKEVNKKNVAIIRMEQLYPFPELEMAQELNNYPNAHTIIWCQEEPMNQGSWYSCQHHVRNILRPDHELLFIGRPDSAAPACGYHKLHEEQQHNLVYQAIGISENLQ